MHNKDMTKLPVQPSVSEQWQPRRIVFLLLPGVQILDLAGPAQVFESAAISGKPYTLQYCAAAKEICSKQRLHLAHLDPLPEMSGNDMILIPGIDMVQANERKEASQLFAHIEHCKPWLQASYRAGVRIASICTGALVLGEVGLLHRRRCTTHWEFVSELQRRYPTAQVIDGVLYVHDRGITTSAGVTAGIDMALWLLERDCGPRFAAEIARQLVVYMRRNGSEDQVSVYLEYRTHLDPCVHRVQDWIEEHVNEPLSLAELAAVGQTSIRSLTRAFKTATGITPHRYQHLLRLELAVHLVKSSSLSLEAIAAKSGLGDPRHFRRVWHQRFGTSPSQSRQHAMRV
jgi:transcriptional regulator GlxA family with amidase domain